MRGTEGIAQGKPSMTNLIFFLVRYHKHIEIANRKVHHAHHSVNVTLVWKPSFREYFYSVTGLVAVLLGCKLVDANEFMVALETVCPVMF